MKRDHISIACHSGKHVLEEKVELGIVTTEEQFDVNLQCMIDRSNKTEYD